MSPAQPITTLDEGCLVEQLERRFPGEVTVIDDDHDPKWEDSRDCASDPEYGDAPSATHEKHKAGPCQPDACTCPPGLIVPGEGKVCQRPKQSNRDTNRAAIRAASPVTLSDAECDQVARFLNAGKKAAATQVVRRKAALIRRQNEKGRNPKQKRK